MLSLAAVVGLLAPMAAATADASTLDSVFARWNSPTSAGCVVGVEQRGKMIGLRAFGSTDLEHGVPNTPATVFEAGSVSKQFTAAGILMLAGQKRLTLTDDIRKYLPEMPDYGTPITVEHLLKHTSGLRDWGFLDELAGRGRYARFSTNNDVLDITARQHALNHAPGAEHSYTNTGYNLLAIIIERVSGQSMAEFYATRIFEPVGMHSTQWRDDYRRTVKGRAVAYQRYGEGPYVKWMGYENAVGDGGLLTTVEDLLRWNAALDARKFGDFVANEIVRTGTLNDGRSLTYAGGLRVGKSLGKDVVWHTGGMGGYRAFLARYAEDGLSVAILCNAGDVEGKEYELGEEVAAQFLTPQERTPRERSSQEIAKARHASARAGLFVNESSHMPLRIVFEAGGLRLQDGAKLEAISADRFRLGRSEFVFASNDRFTRVNRDGTVDTYRRVPATKVDASELDSLTGLYRSDEADATYRISRDSDQLVLQIERHPDFRHVLKPAYADAFTYDTRFGPSTAIIRFIREASGQVSEIAVGWNQRVRDLRFKRMTAPANGAGS